MSVVTIAGAGMMGTALCWPLIDNQHQVRLVGTPLDETIIASLRSNGIHPRLERSIPDGVQPYNYTQLAEAIEGAELVVNGVSSFGIPWFAETVLPLLSPGIPLLSVTKGLVDLPDGDLQILPDFLKERLPEKLQGKVTLNAIGGPCTAHELAARRQTSVVFCGPDPGVLEQLRTLFATSYYHIWPSTDVVGVEVCAALKNAYALAVGLEVGKMEKAGPDGLAWSYNPQAAVFAQSCLEMRRFLEIMGGGKENVSWLPGAGDLYVTIYGGRTVKMGKLLGIGIPYPQARARMADETLESIEIITRVGRALPKLEARRVILPGTFPLMQHLYRIIHHGEKPDLPWGDFFHEIPGLL